MVRFLGAREDGEVRKAATNGLQAGYVSVDEEELRLAGVRGRQSLCLFIIIAVLWVIALITLGFNIILIWQLKITHEGIEWLQFANAASGEPMMVEFKAKEHVFDTVIAGTVGGYQNEDFPISADQIVMHAGYRGYDGRGCSLVVANQTIGISGVNDFMIVNPAGRQLFSAQYPRFRLSTGIKRLATQQMITSRVTSAIDKTLKFQAENVGIRGNEGNHFNAKVINMRSHGDMNFETSKDGAIRLNAADGAVYLVPAAQLPLSPSPDLIADQLEYRLCACNNGRLFLIDGNKACIMEQSYCY